MTKWFGVDSRHKLTDRYGVAAKAVRTESGWHALAGSEREAGESAGPVIVPHNLTDPDADPRAWREKGPCLRGFAFGKGGEGKRKITTGPITAIEGTDGKIYPVRRTAISAHVLAVVLDGSSPR